MPPSFVGLWLTGLLIGVVSGLALLRRQGLLNLASFGAFACAGVGFAVGAKWHYRLELFLPWYEALGFRPLALLEPGGRTPLAVATGGACAGLWCMGKRLPWRNVGDALALAAMVGLSLGRVACIVHGCCVGWVCPHWAASVCVMPHPGTQAFTAQVAAGYGITVLPVIPLSTLFSVVGLCIVGVLLWQLRRGAPPGRVLAIACIAGPFAKAGLELLRAELRPPPLMIGLPLAAGTVAALTVGASIAWRLVATRVATASRQRDAETKFPITVSRGSARGSTN